MDDQPPAAPQPAKTTADITPPGNPQPVVLQPRTDTSPATSPGDSDKPAAAKPGRRRSFHPSRKGTMIALGVILVIIAANAGAIYWLVKYQSKQANKDGLAPVTLGKEQLEQLGTNRGLAGESGEALVVSPNARFSGSVTVDKEVKLSGKLSGADASIANLQAGNTSLTELNVNGASSFSNANVRNDLSVAGTTRLQGTVTVDKLLTANSGLNVSGDLNVGGAFSAGNISARSLTSTSTLTIAGHILTVGAAPGISAGSVGGGGTVSISGSDSAGTIVINTGSGPAAGILASISFRSAFGAIPRVIISPVGSPTGALGYYVNRSATGFSIGSSSTPPAATGFAFDYIVMQ